MPVLVWIAQLEYYTDIKYTAIDSDIQTVLLDKGDGASLQVWRIGWRDLRRSVNGRHGDVLGGPKKFGGGSVFGWLPSTWRNGIETGVFDILDRIGDSSQV